MSRVLTNKTTLAYAIEDSLGVLPGTPIWNILEPNSIGAYGATITTVARSPISKKRQRRKGAITDLDSAVEWEGDATLDHMIAFAEGFAFSTGVNQDLNFRGADTTATAYTVPALSAGQAAKLHWTAGGPISLMHSAGYATAGNNGVHPLTAQPVTTDTDIDVSGLAIETAPSNATADIAGIRAELGDLDITVTGSAVVITSGNNGASNNIDFTTLGLTPGQFIHVGGLTGSEQFSAGAGYCRVKVIAAGQLDCDKPDAALATDPGAGETIDLLFGRFIRNVDTDSAEYLERSFQFELTYPDLDNPAADMYEYAKGNFCNSLTLTMPLTDKATIAFGMIGTDTLVPTASRDPEGGNALEPLHTGAFGTTSDCTRLRIAELDESSTYTDFKSLTLTLNNNASPEKVLCTLGAKFMNTGNFEVDVESQLIFSDVGVASAVRNNTTVTIDFGLKNDDGAMFFDIPATTLGGGDREFPVNESVLINSTAEAFEDPDLGTSIGISFFPVVP